MLSHVTRIVLLATFAIASICTAAEDPAADFQPGKLKLPLTVTERSGVARHGEVVTSGVPFPPGFLKSVEGLRVVDADGKPLPSQAIPMIRWHEPAYDGSVQWALVSFPADVAAGGESTYFLTDAAGPRPEGGLKISRAGGALTVETGAGRFVVPDSGTALISQAWIDGRQVIGGKGLRGVFTSGAWPDRGLEAGSVHTTFHDAVVVEESGPVRAVVAIKGTLTPGDKDRRMYDYTARLYFTANSSAVRVAFTLRNGRLDPKLIDGQRYAYIWPIEDLSLVLDLALPGEVRAATEAEGKPLETALGSDELVVYQDSSGGEKWQTLGGGNYESWLSRYTQGKTVAGVTFRGYTAKLGDKLLAKGNAHRGVVDVRDGEAGVAAALRNFRVEYPSALSASARRVRVGLFPGEFADVFALRPGQRKSWDVRLSLHGPERADLAARHGEQDRLLLFRPSPEWMVRCANTGAWPAGMASLPKPAAAPGRRGWSKDALDGIGAGWDWYGWIASWNAGGGHWNQSTCFTPWVLWGDGANFDSAESCTLWAADLCSIHYDAPDLPTFWLMLMDWNWRENRLKLETYPGYASRDTWGRPDSGHMGMFMWLEYYLLTGDARAREAVEHLGIRARAMCWHHNYDDRDDGTGPLPRAINWCKRRDPDTEADFRLATRYTGWPLYDLSQYYRLTGDPALLAEARTVARSFRNTARYSPIGFMVTQINAKDDGDVYGRQGPFDKGRAASASQCYAHFQQGIMATGLVEYYLMSRDVEALDALTGFADCMVHHAMLRDAEGNRRGWTYAFGDYWGPYRLEDLGGQKTSWFTSNFRIVQPLGWIYRFTGRDDYLAVVKDAVGSGGDAILVPAAHAALNHPKADGTPPAAIADLKAEAIGGGKVRLTWTAPAGGAARYQVKRSAARIVERVEGWPDRTPPLPADRKEWEARAAAFNARHRAFWAADNVPNVPEPAAAGNGQAMTVEGVKAGGAYFAIKTWDAADNVSGLSNVVTVAGE